MKNGKYSLKQNKQLWMTVMMVAAVVIGAGEQEVKAGNENISGLTEEYGVYETSVTYGNGAAIAYAGTIKYSDTQSASGYWGGATAIGGNTYVVYGGTAIGYGADDRGKLGVAVGYKTSLTDGSTYSVAIGAESNLDAYLGVSIGGNTYNNHYRSVALGYNSSTSESDSVSVGNASLNLKRKIMNVANGVADSDAVTIAQIKTDSDGSYIKKSLSDSTTLNTDGTVGKNLTALDNAIGVVTVPTTASSAGRSLLTASTGKLYVLGESLNEDGTLKTSVSANLIKLDQKVGEITSNYGILNNSKSISQNLMALEAAIAKTNQALDFSNVSSTTNGSTTNGVTTNDVTAGGEPSGTTEGSTTIQFSNVIYSNDGTPIAEILQGSVSSGDNGFVSGGQVWNADMAVGQTISLSNTTHNVNGKTIGANQIASNDGTVLATFTKMQEVSASDNGFVSGSDLYNEVRPTDGKYVKNNATTGTNLKALDDAIASLNEKSNVTINQNGDTFIIGGDSSSDNVTIINIAKDDGKARTLTGVADGVNDYDAVNMRQYNALSTDVRAVAAGSAALAALHPGTFDPDDKMSFAVGFGHYKDANAGALGVFYRPNEDTLISVGGTVGNGNPMCNFGLSFKLGERGLPDRKYSGSADMSKAMVSLKKDFAERATRIKMLEGNKNLCNEKLAAHDKTIQLHAKGIGALKNQIAQIMKKLELSDTVKITAVK